MDERSIAEQINSALEEFNKLHPAKKKKIKRKKIEKKQALNFNFNHRPRKIIATPHEIALINDYREARISLNFAEKCGFRKQAEKLIIKSHKFGNVFIMLYNGKESCDFHIVLRHLAFLESGKKDKKEKSNNYDQIYPDKKIGRTIKEIKLGITYGYFNEILSEFVNDFIYIKNLLDLSKKFNFYLESWDQIIGRFIYGEMFIDMYENNNEENKRDALRIFLNNVTHKKEILWRD